MKLSMSIDHLSYPYTDRQFNPLKARICLSDGGFAREVSIISDEDGEFRIEDVAAALRAFADRLST